jgi:hypothetical protein
LFARAKLLCRRLPPTRHQVKPKSWKLLPVGDWNATSKWVIGKSINQLNRQGSILAGFYTCERMNSRKRFFCWN